MQPGRQEQQPGQQRGPADLSERERDLGCGGPARLVAFGSGEQVEGERQRLPAEQQGKGVLRGHDHYRDRAERQGVARAKPGGYGGAGSPPCSGGPGGSSPRIDTAQLANATQTGTAAPKVSARNIPDSRSAERTAARWPGAGSPSHRPHQAGPAARQGEPAQHGQARRPRGAEQVRRPGSQEPTAGQVRHGGQSQQDQRRCEQTAHRVPLPPLPSLPTAISKALRMPNGLGRRARQPDIDRDRGGDARGDRLALAQQPAADTASAPAAMTTFGSGMPS